MPQAKKDDGMLLDKDSKKYIYSMREANLITPEGARLMESTLPLLKYKYKTETKKPIGEWYAEIIMLFIGAFLSAIITTYNSFYLIMLLILFVSRIILYIRTGR